MNVPVATHPGITKIQKRSALLSLHYISSKNSVVQKLVIGDTSRMFIFTSGKIVILCIYKKTIKFIKNILHSKFDY